MADIKYPTLDFDVVWDPDVVLVKEELAGMMDSEEFPTDAYLDRLATPEQREKLTGERVKKAKEQAEKVKSEDLWDPTRVAFAIKRMVDPEGHQYFESVKEISEKKLSLEVWVPNTKEFQKDVQTNRGKKEIVMKFIMDKRLEEGLQKLFTAPLSLDLEPHDKRQWIIAHTNFKQS